MNSCEHYQELISRLVDADVSREEYEELLAHMNTCSRCSALSAVFYDLSGIIGSEESAELPEGLHENIMAGVRRSDLEKKNRRTRTVWTRTALTAAACLALVLFAVRGLSPAERAESSVVRSEEAADVRLSSDAAEAPALPAVEAAPAAGAAEEEAVPAPAINPAAAPKESDAPQQTPAPASPSPSSAQTQQPDHSSPVPIETREAAAPVVTATPEPTTPTAPTPAAVPKESDAPQQTPAPASPSAAPAETQQPTAVTPTPTSPAPATPEATTPAPATPEAVSEPAATASIQREPEQSAQEKTPSPASGESPAPEGVRTAAADTAAAPDGSGAADSVPNAQAEAAAPTPPLTDSQAPRKIILGPRALMNASASAPQSEETLPPPEESESPAPSPSPTPVKSESIRIAKEENRKKLQVLLSGTEAPMPDKTPDRIYEAVLISSDAYGSEEKLSIRVFGTEVWYLSTVSGESTSFSAKCSPKELETLLQAVREDERALASPEPSASPAASSAPAASPTPDPYLGTPAPETPEKK
ncbi:MAG: zf-HC2 domain-containing protein [Eubacteriales bacterium]|nr:zf-HC2 domain-containing protein [Eubacteriales bacterium]